MRARGSAPDGSFDDRFPDPLPRQLDQLVGHKGKRIGCGHNDCAGQQKALDRAEPGAEPSDHRRRDGLQDQESWTRRQKEEENRGSTRSAKVRHAGKKARKLSRLMRASLAG